MAVLLVILPLSLSLAGLALYAFVSATRAGQFDDLATPPNRVLFEDTPASLKRVSN